MNNTFINVHVLYLHSSSIRRKRTDELNETEEDPAEWEKVRRFLRLKKRNAGGERA